MPDICGSTKGKTHGSENLKPSQARAGRLSQEMPHSTRFLSEFDWPTKSKPPHPLQCMISILSQTGKRTGGMKRTGTLLRELHTSAGGDSGCLFGLFARKNKIPDMEAGRPLEDHVPREGAFYALPCQEIPHWRSELHRARAGHESRHPATRLS